MSCSRSQLIPEIQGLRAIAVLAVLFYHIWPQYVPGGYVGVDVFFVISGYLITGSLLNEFTATGSISILGFYARRIRRLLPASILVSLAVALCIPFFSRTQWDDIATSIVASALYAQNWFLVSQAVDYLADGAKGPMNHFWSLSVEEQYYIVWPLLLLPVLRLTKRAALDIRGAFGWCLGLIGISSLAYSVILTPLSPGEAYFATTTRAWELSLGGALAVFQGQLRLPDRGRSMLGFAGLVAIAVTCFAYSEDTHFPGYAALLPTVGSAAVILSNGVQSPWSARSILNTRIAQYFGDISYSLYLWHWPLIIIYSEVTGQSLGIRSGAIILLISCILAHLSKIMVEDYFRHSNFSLRRTLAVGMACVAIPVTVGGAYLTRNLGKEETFAANGIPRGARAMIDPHYDWTKEDLSRVVPRPEKVRADVPSAYARKCHQTVKGTDVLTCDYGNPDSALEVVMVGNSHATHWFPAFEEIARTRPIYFRGIAKSACIFSINPVYNRALKRPYTECAEWSRNVIEWLARERPDIVLISHSPSPKEVAPEELAITWKRLLDLGLDARHVRSIPMPLLDPYKCLADSKDWATSCAPLRSKVLRANAMLRTAHMLNVKVLDFSDNFCDTERCPLIIGETIVYRDHHHMTATFARTLSDAMEEKLFSSPTQ